MDSIPLEILEHICLYLDPLAALNFLRTSRSLGHLPTWHSIFKTIAKKSIAGFSHCKVEGLNWKLILQMMVNPSKVNTDLEELLLYIKVKWGIPKKYGDLWNQHPTTRITVIRKIIRSHPVNTVFGLSDSGVKGTLLYWVFKSMEKTYQRDPKLEKFARIIVDELLDAGADVNLPAIYYNKSQVLDWPLTAAIDSQWAYGLERLLRVDNLWTSVVWYERSVQTCFMSTPFMTALIKGPPAYKDPALLKRDAEVILKLLLQRVAVNEETHNQLPMSPQSSLPLDGAVTALHLYCSAFSFDKQPWYEGIKILLEHGANANAQSKLGVTPLHAFFVKILETSPSVTINAKRVVQMLLEAKADPALQTHEGLNAVHYAHMALKLHKIDAETVKLLEQHCPAAAAVPSPYTVCAHCRKMYLIAANSSAACRAHGKPLVPKPDSLGSYHPCCNGRIGSSGCTTTWHQ